MTYQTHPAPKIVTVTHQLVVLVLENAGQPSNAHAPKVDDASIPQEVDVGRSPAPIVELPQVVGCLMIAANCIEGRAASSAGFLGCLPWLRIIQLECKYEGVKGDLKGSTL